MKLKILFKQLNPDYDEEAAAQYQHDNESLISNKKYILLKQLDLIPEIDQISIIEKADFYLSGKLENGKSTNVAIPNMTILKCIKDGETIKEYAVSKALIEKIHKVNNPKYDTTRFYFYFNQRTDFTEIKNGIYVVMEDVPNELFE